MTQTLFTVITEVVPARLDDLKAVVAAIGADPARNSVLAFGSFEVLHFASLVLAQGEGLPPTLIFEQNIDGSIDSWLKTLVARAGAGIDALYSHCVGYPGGADREKVLAFLADKVVHPGAYHIGATGRSLSRIQQEAGLRQAIEGYLDSETMAGRLPKDGAPIRSSIQEVVGANAEFSWAKTVPPRQTSRERFGHVARLVALVVVAIVLSPLLLPILAVWIVALRIKEGSDPVQQGPADPAYIAAISSTEDIFALNHLASVVPVKPGLLRAVTLPVVLFVLNLVARVTATKGQLAGIPSIHFAHWSRINHGRHLLFLSNFDGSWESYLGDFIDKAASGLTAVWSNAVNFPRTTFLLRKGARDGPRFRQWARASQCPTAAWYSAYPDMTMPIIDNNSSIREGLFAPLKEKEVQAWLRRL